MTMPDWTDAFPASITVCDRNGVLLDLNDRAVEVFAADGGRELIGRNVLDCHPEPARAKMQALLNSGATNVYTIEKQGRKKLIYQAPWYRDGEFAGLVELSIELPAELPHFVRS
ncbi:MAG TPA: PAS domain-containing protein [Anaerolineales bacterium]|nr:PAS domain-containing protein [Anaerolineales bacterium]